MTGRPESDKRSGMDFQDLVDTPQKVKTLAGTVVFLVAFPIYFEALPSLIDDDLGVADLQVFRVLCRLVSRKSRQR